MLPESHKREPQTNANITANYMNYLILLLMPRSDFPDKLKFSNPNQIWRCPLPSRDLCSFANSWLNFRYVSPFVKIVTRNLLDLLCFRINCAHLFSVRLAGMAHTPWRGEAILNNCNNIIWKSVACPERDELGRVYRKKQLCTSRPRKVSRLLVPANSPDFNAGTRGSTRKLKKDTHRLATYYGQRPTLHWRVHRCVHRWETFSALDGPDGRSTRRSRPLPTTAPYRPDLWPRYLVCFRAPGSRWRYHPKTCPSVDVECVLWGLFCLTIIRINIRIHIVETWTPLWL
jgi:hypothetical protein